MINSLIAYGCSNTFGAEANIDYDDNLPDNIYYAYPWYLAQILGCAKENYFNYAKSGYSNQEIASSVFKTLKNHDPSKTFVVIGWTDNNRLPVSYTPGRQSQISLHRVYEHLSWASRLIHIKQYKKNIIKKPKEKKNLTITQGHVKVIYSKLLGLQSNPDSRQKIDYDYHEKNVAPFFESDFITGIEKHLFNTQSYNETHLCIKKAVDSYLQENKFSYLMFTTKYILNRDFINFISSRNYYDWKDHSGFINIIHEYGSKYGMSESGNHMKWQAHKKLAEFLHKIIEERQLIK